MTNAATAQPPRGVIVELDFAVLPGHALMKDICFARFEKEGLKVDDKKYFRYFGGKTFTSGLNALCNKLEKSIEVPAFVAECQSQFSEALKGALSEIPDGFRDFVKALIAKNIKVVLVTRAESEVVQAAFADIDSELFIVQQETLLSFCFTNWEGWRRVARKNSLHERLCMAVAGSGFSLKGAMNSGYSVMVKTNPLTEYQDVSGCDMRVTEFTGALVNDVTQILRV